MPLIESYRSIILGCMMLICGLISAFFIFYTIRLLYMTRALTMIRAGGEGAYIGAVAFPALAALFGFVSWRLLKAARKNK